MRHDVFDAEMFGASAVDSAVAAAASPSLSDIRRKAASGAVSSVQPTTMTFEPEVITLKSSQQAVDGKEAPPPPPPSTSAGMPTWGWALVGLGAVAAVGGVIWAKVRK